MGLMPATRGHSILIPDPRNIQAFVRAIKDFKFEIFCGLNSLFVALLQDRDFQRLDFSRLRMHCKLIGQKMKINQRERERETGCVLTSLSNRQNYDQSATGATGQALIIAIMTNRQKKEQAKT